MKLKVAKFLTLAFISLMEFGILSFSPVLAVNVCDNIDPTLPNGEPNPVYVAQGCKEEEDKLPSTIQNILNVIIGISSFIAVVFIIIGGIQYMTSAGDGGKVKKARETILYAVIGLIVCALSFAIVNFAIGNIDASQSSNTNESIYA